MKTTTHQHTAVISESLMNYFRIIFYLHPYYIKKYTFIKLNKLHNNHT